MDVNDHALCLNDRVAPTFFASVLAPTRDFVASATPVGASLLAMEVNDHAPCLNDRVAPTFFASMLAPTRVSFAQSEDGLLQSNRYTLVGVEGWHCPLSASAPTIDHSARLFSPNSRAASGLKQRLNSSSGNKA